MIDIATGLSIEPPIAGVRFRLAGAAGQRPQRERPQPDLKDPAAAEAVRERARQHEKASNNKGVRIDGPLQAPYRRVQCVLDRRQGDIDDRNVEARHEHGQTTCGQNHGTAPRVTIGTR
jgi:hypothetical protein